MYKNLPQELVIGMRMACPRYDPTPEILEVAKVDQDTGRIWLMRENGVMLHGEFTRQVLADFDYQLLETV